MKEEKIIKQNQDTFNNTLKGFKDCLKNLKLSEDEKSFATLVINAWESKIKDIKWLQNFHRVKNFRSILGFKKELSLKLSFSELMNKIGQHFAEIDCAVHLVREFPSNIQIEKLLKQSNESICDFKVYDATPHFVEVKAISKFSKGKIEVYTKKALEQIECSAGKEGFYGIVWIFTFDNPSDPKQAQDIVKLIKSSSSKPFNYKLNVQVYGRGLYGDATARFI